MTVPYTSYAAQGTGFAIEMLAQAPTWQSITASAGKGRIIEHDGGEPFRSGGVEKAKACDGTSFALAAPWAMVSRARLTPILEGIGVVGYDGEIEVRLFLARRATGETPAESARRAENQAGQIAQEIQAAFGGQWLATGTAELAAIEIPDDAESEITALITIAFQG